MDRLLDFEGFTRLLRRARAPLESDGPRASTDRPSGRTDCTRAFARFAVTAVEVRGASRVEPQRILEVSGIVHGTNLWRIDPDQVRADMERVYRAAATARSESAAELLCAEHFGSVESAVDPHDRLAFLRQRSGLRLGGILTPGEPGTDLPKAIELGMVGRVRNDHHPLVAALGGLADGNQSQPIGFRIELPPVVRELGIRGQAVVIPDVEPELGLGGSDLSSKSTRQQNECEGRRNGRAAGEPTRGMDQCGHGRISRVVVGATRRYASGTSGVTACEAPGCRSRSGD